MNVAHTLSRTTLHRHPATWAVVAAAAAAGTAAWVESRARRAEREHPADGRLMYVDGVRLHYRTRGEGPPLVLLHGNMLHAADFEASGLMDRLARDHRVIAFDRPGFGHSDRPRGRVWTPRRQAALLWRALAAMHVHRPDIVAHSLGTQVALAMALAHPANVHRLVLLGGYYYPSLRLDTLMTAPAAVPVLGDTLRYTVANLAARATLDATVRQLFAPLKVPRTFWSDVLRDMLLRPLQMRATSEDGSCMVQQARVLAQEYGRLRVPLTLVAGEEDRVVDPRAQSARLHREIPGSELFLVPGTGHMAHYVAQTLIAERVAPAAAQEASERISAMRSDLPSNPMPASSGSTT